MSRMENARARPLSVGSSIFVDTKGEEPVDFASSFKDVMSGTDFWQDRAGLAG
jgi:hypothetical protein